MKVEYISVDVRDADAVYAAVNNTRALLGELKGLIHAAGVLADKTIADKTPAQFQQVYSTKVDGMNALLAATQNDDLRFMVMFSSTTARLGRKGQCDYAAANEVLNKIAQQQAMIKPNCRVAAVNWGPWDGGMVTPTLKKLFAAEGVDVIDVQAGAKYLLSEISQQGATEIVIVGGKSLPVSPALEFNRKQQLHVAFARNININDYVFLQSHIMNGKAVLPVAIIIEWFAHGAMHGNPGLQFHGFDNLQILKGVILGRDESIELHILAANAIKHDNKEIVAVELHSPAGLHATANVLLVDAYEAKPLAILPAVKGDYPYKDAEIYTEHRLFHGKHFQGIKTIKACSEHGVVANVQTAPAPEEWMIQPIRSVWLADPLMLDASFQMMILWSHEVNKTPSLPTAIGSYRQYKRGFADEIVRVVIKVNEKTKHRANASIEFLDENNRVFALIDNYQCVLDESLKTAFRKNTISMEEIIDS